MKTLLLILTTIVMCLAEDKVCYVWHFDKKGKLFMADTLTTVYMGDNFKYWVMDDDSNYYYSYTKRNIRKSNLDQAEVIFP